MSETPRTDDAQFGTGRVSVSFARTLERELTAARAELALHEDNARQSLEEIEALRANFDEWSCRARAFEDERDQARAELAKAHRRIHGYESEDCVFCASKKQTPGGDDPQCCLCALEDQPAALRAEQDKPNESRSRTILRSMIAALDRTDEKTYFECFDLLQNVTLEVLEDVFPASPPRDLREGGE